MTLKSERAKKRRKPASQRRTNYLRVRLTDDQQRLINDAAMRTGINVSAWSVERLIRIAREELGTE